MLEMLKKLEIVQELDLQILGLKNKIAEFPNRLATFDTEILMIETKIAEKKKTTEEQQKILRQHKGALELNEDRSKRSQEKIAGVKTSNELGAAQREVESLKKNSEVVGEAARKLEEDLAKHNAEIAALSAAITEIQGKRASESGKISGEEQSITKDLATLESKRKDSINGIEVRYLTVYDRIRVARGGVGLAFAITGSCRGCNVRIPAQVFNELQRGSQLHTCPNCKRILAYKDATKAATV